MFISQTNLPLDYKCFCFQWLQTWLLLLDWFDWRAAFLGGERLGMRGGDGGGRGENPPIWWKIEKLLQKNRDKSITRWQSTEILYMWSVLIQSTRGSVWGACSRLRARLSHAYRVSACHMSNQCFESVYSRSSSPAPCLSFGQLVI